MSAGDRLREMMKRAGVSFDRAAKAMGLRGASSVQGYLKPDREFLPWDKTQMLLPLLVGKGSPPITEIEVYSLAGINPVITNRGRRITSGSEAALHGEAIEIAAAGLSPYGLRDLPVLGHSRGGGNEYFFDNGADVLSLTYRPLELLNVRDAYAVYVHGDSMSPRYRPGEMLYVDPVRPVSPGDDVIVQLKTGQGFIKELVRRTGRAVICRQHNPASEVEYPSEQVRSIHYRPSV